jgi:hypothetical protein
MGPIWPGPTLNWPALGRRGLPYLGFGPAQWGSLSGWSLAGAGENPLLWCAHAGHRWRPADFVMPMARQGGENSMGTRRRGDSGLGLRGGRCSPGDALHSGGDSKMGAGGGSSDQRSRRPAAGSRSCVALPHSLGRCAWGGQLLEARFDGEVLSPAGKNGAGTCVKLSDRRLGDGS